MPLPSKSAILKPSPQIPKPLYHTFSQHLQKLKNPTTMPRKKKEVKSDAKVVEEPEPAPEPEPTRASTEEAEESEVEWAETPISTTATTTTMPVPPPSTLATAPISPDTTIPLSRVAINHLIREEELAAIRATYATQGRSIPKVPYRCGGGPRTHPQQNPDRSVEQVLSLDEHGNAMYCNEVSEFAVLEKMMCKHCGNRSGLWYKLRTRRMVQVLAL